MRGRCVRIKTLIMRWIVTSGLYLLAAESSRVILRKSNVNEPTREVKYPCEDRRETYDLVESKYQKVCAYLYMNPMQITSMI